MVVVLLVLLSDRDCHTGELVHDPRKLGCRGVIALTEAARGSLPDGSGIGFQAHDLGIALGGDSLQFGNGTFAPLFLRLQLARLVLQVLNATKQRSISAAPSNAVSPSTPALPFWRSRSTRLRPMGSANC